MHGGVEGVDVGGQPLAEVSPGADAGSEDEERAREPGEGVRVAGGRGCDAREEGDAEEGGKYGEGEKYKLATAKGRRSRGRWTMF